MKQIACNVLGAKEARKGFDASLLHHVICPLRAAFKENRPIFDFHVPIPPILSEHAMIIHGKDSTGITFSSQQIYFSYKGIMQTFEGKYKEMLRLPGMTA